jgi:hypothetical protein
VAHTIAETFAVLSAPAGPYPALPEDVIAYLQPLLGTSRSASLPPPTRRR